MEAALWASQEQMIATTRASQEKIEATQAKFKETVSK
jgi:hypothetical protein